MAKEKPDIYKDQKENGRINARIIDTAAGLTTISEIYAVRIHSKDFHALIMNDYLPTLGKIDGDITFLSGEGEHSYFAIKGFYKHQHNEFTLLVEERN